MTKNIIKVISGLFVGLFLVTACNKKAETGTAAAATPAAETKTPAAETKTPAAETTTPAATS
jgi:hypothetical protein